MAAPIEFPRAQASVAGAGLIPVRHPTAARPPPLADPLALDVRNFSFHLIPCSLMSPPISRPAAASIYLLQAQEHVVVIHDHLRFA